MNDMSGAIAPKSDQINADDLIAGPRTIRITEVTIRATPEQPVSIHFDGDNGKPFKPCKSMSRVLVAAWGPDAKVYTGRSLTLYRDPKVKWGGLEVGGIRISHMSHIERDMVMALTETKGKRSPFKVCVLQSGQARGQTTGDGGAKAAEAADALIARIDAAASTEALTAITDHAVTVKQMARFAEAFPDLHQRVSDAINLRLAALTFEPEGRDDADMGEAHVEEPADF